MLTNGNVAMGLAAPERCKQLAQKRLRAIEAMLPNGNMRMAG